MTSMRKYNMSSNGTIFIVEDDLKLTSIIKEYLLLEGYQVNCFTNGNNLISDIQDSAPNLILLDIMMEGKSGLHLCQAIRTFSDVPIIFVTAKNEDTDRLLGFKSGADDYICKPFHPQELVYRVKSMLRRVIREPVSGAFHSGPLALDTLSHRVACYGEVINLTPIEFELLKIFMANPSKVFSKDDLIEQVFGSQYEGYVRTLNTHIKNLRKKLNDNIPEHCYIKTAYGFGYGFNLFPD